MKLFDIDFFKTENLTPDELDCKRRNSAGLWLCGPIVEALTPRSAILKARKMGYKKVRIGKR